MFLVVAEEVAKLLWKFTCAQWKFNQCGAILFERDIRIIDSFFASKSNNLTMGKCFSDLLSAAFLLNCDSPSEAFEEGNVDFSLENIKTIICQRIDFDHVQILNCYKSKQQQRK